MAKASTQKPIDKDQVRMMIADVGYQETSKALNILEPTLRQWAHRGQWFTLSKPHPQAVTSVTKPADAHASLLQRYKEQSKVNLARYASEASQEAAEHPQKLSISRKAKDVADIRASIWPQESNNNNILQIGFLVGPRQEPGEKPAQGEVIDVSQCDSEPV